MEDDYSTHDTQSFIVRVWREVEDKAGYTTAWRGSIDHVGSGKRLYFYELNSMIEFIEQYLGLRPNRPISKWRTWWSKTLHMESSDE